MFSNSLGNGVLNKAVWTKQMQIVREKELVVKAITNFELRALLSSGDTIHKPYRSKMYPQTYTKGTDVVVQDVSATDETLVVSTAKIVPFYIDEIDEVQNSYKTARDFAGDAQADLNQLVDGMILGEYAQADSNLFAADVGDSGASTPIVPTASNVIRIVSAFNKKLNLLNVKKNNRFVVFSPSLIEMLTLYIAGKDSAWGDKVGINGFMGRFLNCDIYMSNNLAYTARWTPANQPSDDDTLTIAGRTITFKTTLSGAKDEVYSVTDVATTLDNLVLYLNGADAGSTHSAQSASTKEAFFDGMTATDGTTYVDIELEGAGEIDVAASESADLWSLEIVHSLGGRKGATDLVMQKLPNVRFKDDPDRIGSNVFTWELLGFKTFDDGDAELVDINIDATVI